MYGQLNNLSSNLEKSKHLNLEIILVHDEQDALTQGSLEDLLERFPTIKTTLLRKTVNSPGLARNLGIKIAEGEWIAFWDADDEVFPEMYIELIREANEVKAQVAVGLIETYSVGSIPSAPHLYKLSHDFEAAVLDLAYLPGFTRFIFKRDAFSTFKFPKYLLGEDLEFLASTNFLDYRLHLSDLVLYRYYIKTGSQATNRSDLGAELVEVCKKLLSNLRSSSHIMKTYLILQILRVSLSIGKHPTNLLFALKVISKLLMLYPQYFFRSAYSLLRRRNEFRIR
jgi:glycosyltransferase involved in cell wall biosynthesis